MDYSPLLKSLVQFWWLIPTLLLIGVAKSAWFKGVVGETLVRASARIALPSDIYHSIHNVTLPTLDGTTQIDHVVISRFGIFVIETKHMRGWIFGNERDAQWTQRIFKQTYKFQNPLRQNYKHLKALEATLGVPFDQIHSVVVFSGDATFKTEVPSNVVKGSGYIRFIKSFQATVLSDAEVSGALSRLGERQLPATLATRRQHIDHLKARRDPTAERKCPACGSQMLVRTAKTGRNAGGQFWGCSSYPRCKVVQSVA